MAPLAPLVPDKLRSRRRRVLRWTITRCLCLSRTNVTTMSLAKSLQVFWRRQNAALRSVCGLLASVLLASRE